MTEFLVSKKFPELFHYTSVDALEGILRTRQFWATHYGDMNDTSEHKRFFQKAREFIHPLVAAKFEQRIGRDAAFASRIQKSGGRGRVIARESEMHIRTLHDSIFGRLAGPFIVSFCSHDPSSHESGNGLLSQWRGYGARGGVAIVLSTAGMERAMQQEACIFSHAINHLGDVKYDNDDAGIRKDFHQFFDTAGTVIEAFYEGTQPPYEKIFSHFVRGTTLVKHHAFHEERELRIVVCPRVTSPDSVFYGAEHEGKPTKTIKYRPRCATEARYLELFGSQPLPIERIVVGPSQVQNLTKQRIDQALSGANIEVTFSDIPFVG